MSEGSKNPLGELYRARFDERQRQAKHELWAVLVRDYLQRWVAPDDTVLDLGCGFGEFLNHVRCGQKLGVDLNPDAAGHLEPGTDFHHGGIDDLGHVSDGSVDVVFTSNVLEHLQDKSQVEKALLEVRRVSRPGGLLMALGPNLRFLPGIYWDFWDHSVPITDRSLSELLVSLGFSLERVIPRFLPYTTCSKMPSSPALVRMYLRLPWVWPLFGRQFLVLARTPRERANGS